MNGEKFGNALHIRLKGSELDAVKELAARAKRSVSDYVRILIRRDLERKAATK